MNNAVYLQSGGPTSVINSSFYGVISQFQKENKIDHLYGAKYGISGLINDQLIEISRKKDYSYLTKLPGAILGSARIKLTCSCEAIEKILSTIENYSIKYVFVNGGNDSMDTGMVLNKVFKERNIDCVVVGIIKTIDNDLYQTDFTPGFASAVNYIVRSIMEISFDVRSYQKGRVTVIETMGRDTGWLCASSSIAQDYDLGPDLIYVPETSFSEEKFIQDVERIYKEKGRVLVCVSEALKDENGNYIFCDDCNLDSFGHIQLGSVGISLCKLIKNKLHYSTRHIELNLMQRCSSHISNKNDIKWAKLCGVNAVKYALKKQSGVVVIKIKDHKFSYELVDFEKVANKVKEMPRDFINKEGNGISNKGKEYFSYFKDDSIYLEIPQDFNLE